MRTVEYENTGHRGQWDQKRLDNAVRASDPSTTWYGNIHADRAVQKQMINIDLFPLPKYLLTTVKRTGLLATRVYSDTVCEYFHDGSRERDVDYQLIVKLAADPSRTRFNHNKSRTMAERFGAQNACTEWSRYEPCRIDATEETEYVMGYPVRKRPTWSVNTNGLTLPSSSVTLSDASFKLFIPLEDVVFFAIGIGCSVGERPTWGKRGAPKVPIAQKLGQASQKRGVNTIEDAFRRQEERMAGEKRKRDNDAVGPRITDSLLYQQAVAQQDVFLSEMGISAQSSTTVEVHTTERATMYYPVDVPAYVFETWMSGAILGEFKAAFSGKRSFMRLSPATLRQFITTRHKYPLPAGGAEAMPPWPPAMLAGLELSGAPETHEDRMHVRNVVLPWNDDNWSAFFAGLGETSTYAETQYELDESSPLYRTPAVLGVLWMYMSGHDAILYKLRIITAQDLGSIAARIIPTAADASNMKWCNDARFAHSQVLARLEAHTKDPLDEFVKTNVAALLYLCHDEMQRIMVSYRCAFDTILCLPPSVIVGLAKRLSGPNAFNLAYGATDNYYLQSYCGMPELRPESCLRIACILPDYRLPEVVTKWDDESDRVPYLSKSALTEMRLYHNVLRRLAEPFCIADRAASVTVRLGAGEGSTAFSMGDLVLAGTGPPVTSEMATDRLGRLETPEESRTREFINRMRAEGAETATPAAVTRLVERGACFVSHGLIKTSHTSRIEEDILRLVTLVYERNLNTPHPLLDFPVNPDGTATINKFDYTAEQVRAIRATQKYPISIVTGPAGSGKSKLADAILYLGTRWLRSTITRRQTASFKGYTHRKLMQLVRDQLRDATCDNMDVRYVQSLLFMISGHITDEGSLYTMVEIRDVLRLLLLSGGWWVIILDIMQMQPVGEGKPVVDFIKMFFNVLPGAVSVLTHVFRTDCEIVTNNNRWLSSLYNDAYQRADGTPMFEVAPEAKLQTELIWDDSYRQVDFHELETWMEGVITDPEERFIPAEWMFLTYTNEMCRDIIDMYTRIRNGVSSYRIDKHLRVGDVIGTLQNTTNELFADFTYPHKIKDMGWVGLKRKTLVLGKNTKPRYRFECATNAKESWVVRGFYILTKIPGTDDIGFVQGVEQSSGRPMMSIEAGAEGVEYVILARSLATGDDNIIPWRKRSMFYNAMANTVHVSQGEGRKNVVFVMRPLEPGKTCEPISNLIFTASTRTITQFTFVANRDTIHAAVHSGVKLRSTNLDVVLTCGLASYQSRIENRAMDHLCSSKEELGLAMVALERRRISEGDPRCGSSRELVTSLFRRTHSPLFAHNYDEVRTLAAKSKDDPPMQLTPPVVLEGPHAKFLNHLWAYSVLEVRCAMLDIDYMTQGLIATYFKMTDVYRHLEVAELELPSDTYMTQQRRR